MKKIFLEYTTLLILILSYHYTNIPSNMPYFFFLNVWYFLTLRLALMNGCKYPNKQLCKVLYQSDNSINKMNECLWRRVVTQFKTYLIEIFLHQYCKHFDNLLRLVIPRCLLKSIKSPPQYHFRFNKIRGLGIFFPKIILG